MNMRIFTVGACVWIAWGCIPTFGEGEQVRYFIDRGVTYKETRHVVHRPVSRTEWQERDQVVYTPKWREEQQETVRAYYTPVTEYRWKTQIHGRWNPFLQPFIAQSWVPVTRWERRTEVVQVPVRRQEWVAEHRKVRVPVMTQRLQEKTVIRRVAVSGPADNQGIASGSTVLGGVARLESDPPRSFGGGMQTGRLRR